MIREELFDLVPETSYWPLDRPIDNRDVGLTADVTATWARRAWRLDLCRDGTLSLRRNDVDGEAIGPEHEEPLNGAALPVYYHDDRDALDAVQLLTCKPGDVRDERLTHEDGVPMLFSWIALPGTRWQLTAVQRVIHIFLTRDDGSRSPAAVTAARAEARRLDRSLDAAEEDLRARLKLDLREAARVAFWAGQPVPGMPDSARSVEG